MYNTYPPYGYGPQPSPFMFSPYGGGPPPDDPIKRMKQWEKFKRKEEARLKRLTDEQKKSEPKKPDSKSAGWSRLEIALFLTLMSPFIGLGVGHAFLISLNNMVQLMQSIPK